MTHAQRFDVTMGTNDVVYAPFTLGCPSMLFAVDRKVFEHTMEEKWRIYQYKKQHGKTKHHKFTTSFKGSV